MSYQRYMLNGNETENKPLDVRLLYITKANYDADWKSVMHTHSFAELFYVVSGKGNFIVENRNFSVSADDLVIINPDVPHVEYGNKLDQLEYIVLGIEGLLFQSAETDHTYSYRLDNYHDYKDEILHYLLKMLREVHNKNENYEKFCHSLLECLLFFLTRHTNDILSFDSPKKALRECRFIEQYLEEHFAENITLECLSEITHLNKYYLVHIFGEYKGTSPINYLIQCRIQEAANLLKTSDYSINKISHAVGFSSQSYFAKIFRKEKGCSPRDYRAEKKQNPAGG